uniref:hypothetical protein n=1 Tax=Agathobacter sp. TaxID=2021311 RepID=UPI0040572F72
MFACPNCGGNLKFDISSQKLACEYCRNTADPYTFDKKEHDAAEQTDFDATVFTCPQCGGEILSTDTSAAEFCSFCGASTILYSRIRKEKRPSYIIPFQKTKEDCKQAYSALMKKAIFAPDDFKDPKRIDGFRGIYMPYWAFHMTQNQSFALKGSRTHRRGDYIYTDHYSLHGEIDANYRGLSYDASSSFDDTISEKLAPFNVKDMKPFTPAYLSGFYADTPDVDANIYVPDAKEIANETSMDKILKTPDFSTYAISGGADIHLHTDITHIDSTMFPVWFLSYRNGNRVAYATINGQTGKVVSDLPIDLKKYMIGSLVLAIPIFILLNLLFTITPRTLLGITIGIAILSLFLFMRESSQIKKKETGENDLGNLYRQQLRGDSNPQMSAAKPMAEKPNEEKAYKKKSLGFFTSLAAIVFGIAIFVLNPVSDLFFYGAAMLSLVGILITVKDIMHNYNILATRRLPQFDRTGGDDYA